MIGNQSHNSCHVLRPFRMLHSALGSLRPLACVSLLTACYRCGVNEQRVCRCWKGNGELRGREKNDGRLVAGKTLGEWAAHHEAKKAKGDPHRILNYVPTRPWTRVQGVGEKQNETSHDLLTDAGVRINAKGETFRAWHSPNVRTEPATDDGFAIFGIAPLRRRVSEPQTRTRTRRTATIRRNQVVRPGADGAWDEPVIDDTIAEDKRSKTAHDAYLKDSAARAAALDDIYRRYVGGEVQLYDALSRQVLHFLKIKGDTQHDLFRHRRTGNTEDEIQQFLAVDGGENGSVWSRIERGLITGPLSHYLNRAFRLHFIDANKRAKARAEREINVDWNAFVGRFVGLDPATQSDDDVDVDENEDSDVASVVEMHLQTEPEQSQPQPAPEPEKSREHGPLHRVPLRRQHAALERFRRRHREGSLFCRVLDHWMRGLKGKESAELLNVSASKVSRARKQIAEEIEGAAKATAGNKEVAA